MISECKGCGSEIENYICDYCKGNNYDAEVMRINNREDYVNLFKNDLACFLTHPKTLENALFYQGKLVVLEE